MKVLVKILVVCVFMWQVYGQNPKPKKCQVPAESLERTQNVINQCQDEIKIALLTEALEVIKEDERGSIIRRAKRDDTFNEEERRIAGCLLQCVYRKMNAVDSFGFPTVEGLVEIYASGVKDQQYRLVTLRAVQECLGTAQQKHVKTIPFENGKTCDVAYDTFECVSESISQYCT